MCIGGTVSHNSFKDIVITPYGIYEPSSAGLMQDATSYINQTLTGNPRLFFILDHGSCFYLTDFAFLEQFGITLPGWAWA